MMTAWLLPAALAVLAWLAAAACPAVGAAGHTVAHPRLGGEHGDPASPTTWPRVRGPPAASR
jgi:hypothetical protein